MPDFSDPLALQQLNKTTPSTPTAEDLATVRQGVKEAERQKLWEGIGAGGYEAVNQALMGLPDFLVKRVAGSKAYQDLLDWKAKNQTAQKIGGVGGLVAGAVIDAPIQAVKGIAKAGRAGLAARDIGQAARALEAAKVVAQVKNTPEALAALKAAQEALDIAQATKSAKNLAFAGKLAALSEAPTTLKEAAKQASIRAGTAGAIQAGTTGDVEAGLKTAALGTALGTAGGLAAGKIFNPSVAKGLAARAEKAEELPKNITLATAGVSRGDIQAGIMEANRLSRIQLAKQNKRLTAAGEAPQPLPKKVSLEQADVAVDAVKDYLEPFITKNALRDKDALASYVSKRTDNELASEILALFAQKGEGLDADTAFQTVSTLRSIAKADKARDLTEAAQIGQKVEQKLASAGKNLALGTALGTLGGGISTIPGLIQGEPVDTTALAKGALVGLGTAAALKGAKAVAPAAAKALSKVQAPLLKAEAKAVEEAPGTIARAGAQIPATIAALPKEKQEEIEAAKPKEMDMLAWEQFFDETAKNAWASEMNKLPADLKVPYYMWFQENVDPILQGNYAPDVVARADLPFISKRDKDAILKDYMAKKNLSEVDLNYLLKRKGLLDIIAPDRTKEAKQYELFRTLISPGVGTSMSSSQKIQLEKDLNAIRNQDISQDKKEELFFKLLKERYGYNPDYLKRLGLGD